jgi:hypothetical protein
VRLPTRTAEKDFKGKMVSPSSSFFSGGTVMTKKWMSILLALLILALFSFGCAGVAKDAKVKCPKCGAVFTIDEGLAEVQKKGY